MKTKRKPPLVAISILAVIIAGGVVWRSGGFREIINLVKKPSQVASLINIDRYYGQIIKVRGKLNCLAKVNFIRLESGERLAVCCGDEIGPELHQQWVEIVGRLEPPKELDPNLPVGAQYTGAILRIKRIRGVEASEVSEEVVLKGYIDSAGRRGYQQIFTVYVDEKPYLGYWFFVGSENKQLDLDDPSLVALVSDGGNLISARALDQKISIYGTRTNGSLCYRVGKTHKGDEEGEEVCLKMPVVIVDDILDQNGSSLLSQPEDSGDF